MGWRQALGGFPRLPPLPPPDQGRDDHGVAGREDPEGNRDPCRRDDQAAERRPGGGPAVLLVTGDDKAEILHRVLQGPRRPVVLPAEAIRPSERPAIWLLDRAAANLKRSLSTSRVRAEAVPQPPVDEQEH